MGQRPLRADDSVPRVEEAGNLEDEFLVTGREAVILRETFSARCALDSDVDF